MKILVSACEASSDAHGARLIEALKRKQPDLDAFGIGGAHMQKVGVRTFVDANELSVMGSSEVLGRLPRIVQSLDRVTRAAEDEWPDLAVFLDYPEFHFKLVKRLKRMQIPVVYYIPPKVWVWRKSRIKFLQSHFRKILYVFPFEKEVYRPLGDQAVYVGNPVLESFDLSLTQEQRREASRRALGLDEDDRVVVLMLGSRPGEISRHRELMIEAAQRAARALQGMDSSGESRALKVLIPFSEHIDVTSEEKKIRALFPRPKNIEIQVLQGQSHLALSAADAGLIKSGTSTLEAGLLGCPHVIVYKPSWLTSFLFRNLVRYKGPVGLVNLVLNGTTPKRSYPFKEILMGEVKADLLSRELVSLLTDQERRETLKKEMFKLKPLLSVENEVRASEVAAAQIENVVEETENEPKVFKVGRVGRVGLRARGGAFLRALRVAVSTIWSLASGLARKLLDWGIFKPERLPTKVVSVGNIQAGGAGKTPVVAYLAREAIGRGLRVGILTRGYKSEWEKTGGVIFPKREAPSASVCGDEPALLHELAPEAWIGVGADRVRSFKRLEQVAEPGLDLVILDDGFQHWKIKKDIELLLLTSSSRSERLFRDWPWAAKRADLLVWTKGEHEPANYGKPLVKMRYLLEKSNQTPVWLVSGLADNAETLRLVRESGYLVRKHLTFSDHWKYDRDSIDRMLRQAKRDDCQVALTGKDWVKWRELGVRREDVVVLEPNLSMVEGSQNWNQSLWGELP